MGAVCVHEKDLAEISRENDKLSSENLMLLKAIAMRYIDEEDHATSIKVLNIRWITKQYYSKVQGQRIDKMKNRHLLEICDFDQLESTLKKENVDLLKANKDLKKSLDSVAGFFSFLAKNPRNYTQEFKKSEEKLRIYRDLQLKLKNHLSNRRSSTPLISFNTSKNLNIDIQQQLLLICRNTSHIANNRERTVLYNFQDSNTSMKKANTVRFKEIPSKNAQRASFRHSKSRRFKV